jgi:hypothetical protein
MQKTVDFTYQAQQAFWLLFNCGLGAERNPGLIPVKFFVRRVNRRLEPKWFSFAASSAT